MQQLRESTKIHMPSQELHYFNNEVNYGRGQDWYLRHFKFAKPHQIIGEKTPDYIWIDANNENCCRIDTPSRIKELNADIKLIVLLREPTERFLSAWHHNIRLGRIRENLTFHEIKNSPEYLEIYLKMVDRGLYYSQISAYLEHFPRENLLVLFHDDVKKQPSLVLNKVSNFLTLSDELAPKKKDYNKFETSAIVAKLSARLPTRMRHMIQAIDRRVISKLGLKSVSYPTLTESDAKYLKSKFLDDLKSLDLFIEKIPERWL